MSLNLFFTSILVCLSFQFPAFALDKSEIPYEKCSDPQIKFTKRIDEEVKSFLEDYEDYEDSSTEADFCSVCESIGLWLTGQENQLTPIPNPISQSIPKECFVAMARRGNKLFAKKQYIQCSNSDSLGRPKARQKICVNETYINMISSAFNKVSNCFDLDQNTQAEIFHLINQESGGILNVRSESRAKCLGQITKDYVYTLNNRIKSSISQKENSESYPEIYNQAVSKCPFLGEKILKNKKNKKNKNVQALTCKSTHDPYTCLFYTMYGLKYHQTKIKDKLTSEQGNMGSREFPEEHSVEKFLKIPIKRNEMLTIKGTLPNGKVINWVMWGDEEVYNVESLRNLTQKDFKKLTVKKVPLFKKQRNIETLFTYWSHNGGVAYTGPRLIGMVEYLKRNLASSCTAKQKNQARCILREKIASGKSLTAKEVFPIFQIKLGKYYNKRRRRKEVRNYPSHIDKISKKVFDEDSLYMLKNFYKNSVPNDAQSKIDFQKHISHICPKSNFITPNT